MITLDLQSTSVKGHAERGGLVHVFTSAGVDLYRPLLTGWVKVCYAALPSVTCGAVNDYGIWLGTSTGGLWFLPHGLAGNATGQLQPRYSGTASVQTSGSNIVGLAGYGQRLLAISTVGVDYFASPAIKYTYAVTGCQGPCAMNATHICYAVESAVHYLASPAADWSPTSAHILSTSSAPALASNTIKQIAFGADLFIATAAGVNVIYTASVTVPNASDLTNASWTKSFSTATAATVLRESSGNGVHQAYLAADIEKASVTERWTVTADVERSTSGTRNAFVGFSKPGVGNTGSIIDPDDGSIAGHFANATGWTRISTSVAVISAGKYRVTVVADLDTTDLVNMVVGLASGTTLSYTGDGASNMQFSNMTMAKMTQQTIAGAPLGIWPQSSAAAASGYLAIVYAASTTIRDQSTGGEAYGLNSGGSKVWIDDHPENLLVDDDLDRLVAIDYLSPVDGAFNVRRDWSIYAEVVDKFHGTDSSSISLTVDGVAVTETVTALAAFSSGFSSGFGGSHYAVSYTPASPSGYRARVALSLSFDGLSGGAAHTLGSSFVTVAAPTATPSIAAVPNVVVMKNLSLAEITSEAIYDSVKVNWGEEISSRLIVTEAQAQAVGTVAVEKGIYHRNLRSLGVLSVDSNGDASRDLQQGDIITFSCSANGESTKKAEVLSIQRRIDNSLDGSEEYTIAVACFDLYEEYL